MPHKPRDEERTTSVVQHDQEDLVSQLLKPQSGLTDFTARAEAPLRRRGLHDEQPPHSCGMRPRLTGSLVLNPNTSTSCPGLGGVKLKEAWEISSLNTDREVRRK